MEARHRDDTRYITCSPNRPLDLRLVAAVEQALDVQASTWWPSPSVIAELASPHDRRPGVMSGVSEATW
jgi:hypothetical protein